MNRSGALLIAALAIPLLAAACGGTKESTVRVSQPSRTCTPVSTTGPTAVPNVVGSSLQQGLSQLASFKLLGSVARFPAFANPFNYNEGWLDNYLVASQSPKAGEASHAGKTVALTVTYHPYAGPTKSPTAPAKHPGSVEVPKLVGLYYEQALDAEKLSGGPAGRSGLFVLVGKTGPLSAAASRCGLNAFVVTSQSPKAGTVLPWGGLNGTKVTPKLATVTIALASRAPSS